MNKKEKEDKRKEKEVIVRWKQNTAIKGNYLEKFKRKTTTKIQNLKCFQQTQFYLHILLFILNLFCYSEFPTNAFGVIHFEGSNSKPSSYIRLADNTTMQR